MKAVLTLQNVSAGYSASRYGATSGFVRNGRHNSRKQNMAEKGNSRRQPVLHDINLSVQAGELVIIAGPNGSGKSTLLKTAAGLLAPLSGSVAINGREIGAMKLRERSEYTAFLFQGRESPWPFSVRETIAQGRFSRMGWLGAETKSDREAVEAALEKADLLALSDRPITELSGGELQRVYIARCIAQGATFLLLDEPENNLDPKYSYMAMTLLSELVNDGRGAIVSLHDLRLASRFAHRIILISGNTISASGSPADVLTEEKLSRAYDLDGDLVRSLIL